MEIVPTPDTRIGFLDSRAAIRRPSLRSQDRHVQGEEEAPDALDISLDAMRAAVEHTEEHPEVMPSSDERLT